MQDKMSALMSHQLQSSHPVAEECQTQLHKNTSEWFGQAPYQSFPGSYNLGH